MRFGSAAKARAVAVAGAHKPRDEGEDHPYVFQENLREVAMTGGVIQVAKTLSKSSSAALVEICEEFRSVFSFDGKLGDCRLLQHGINTGNAKPVHTPPYRNSHLKRQEIQAQVDEWLEAGVIQPSSSPWSSPVV